MNKKSLYLLISIASITLSNCNSTNNSDSEDNTSEEASSIYRPSWVVDSHEEVSSIDDEDIDYLGPDYRNNLGENFYGVSPINKASSSINNWNSSYSDGTSFKSASNIVKEETFVNNKQVDKKVEIGTSDDVKSLFYDKNNYACFVNNADGYTFSVPTEFTYKGDFSLG